jgi:hypothetical protein
LSVWSNAGWAKTGNQSAMHEFLSIYKPDQCIYELNEWAAWRYEVFGDHSRRWRVISEFENGVYQLSVGFSYASSGKLYDTASGEVKSQDEQTALITLKSNVSAGDDSIWLDPWVLMFNLNIQPSYKWLAAQIEGVLNNPKLGGMHGYYPIPLPRKNTNKRKNA